MRRPRWIEEDIPPGYDQWIVKETPPWTWRKPAMDWSFGFCNWSTPTGEGKTVRDLSKVSYRWKHPHWRGEDVFVDVHDCVE